MVQFSKAGRFPYGASRFRRGFGRLLVCLLAVSLPGAVSAQETVLAIEFSFSNPGARSMGLGGAFAGLADDATAAFANPAGLVQLTRSEISAEARSWDYSTPFSQGGRLSGEPTGFGIDTVAGLGTGRSSDELTGLSFLSLVYPRDRWSIAVFRHQSANFEFFGETAGFLRSVPEGGYERFNDQRSNVDLEIVSHGAAVAYEVTEILSLGFGLSYFDGELLSESELYKAITLFDPPLFRPEDIELVSVLSFESTDWAWSGGLLWRLSERWRLGAFYREAPVFELEGMTRSGPRGPAPDGTLVGEGSAAVSLPDVYGLGLAFRSSGGRVALGFEWDRVEYATIIDSLEGTGLEGTTAIDDGDEWHLGGEYVIVESSPIVAVRAGVWLDPDHNLRAREDTSLLIRALRPPGEDETHYAAGVGVAFPGLQIDLAIDLSDFFNDTATTEIYTF
jgi:long-subunit fatty acid transport protein